MTEAIYDDPTFFAGYAMLPRSVSGLAGAPEWPALRALLAGRPVPLLGDPQQPHALSYIDDAARTLRLREFREAEKGAAILE